MHCIISGVLSYKTSKYMYNNITNNGCDPVSTPISLAPPRRHVTFDALEKISAGQAFPFLFIHT